MGHLAHDLMHRCILRGDPLQREAKFRTLVKIIRALPARLLINEVVFGRRPWRGNKAVNCREERLRKSLERISIQSSRFDKPLQGNYFLRGHTHSLAERRIESTDHIDEREQTIRKTVKRLKASPNAARKAEPVDGPDRYSAPNRVIDGLRSQGLGKRNKVSNALRHGLTMHAG